MKKTVLSPEALAALLTKNGKAAEGGGAQEQSAEDISAAAITAEVVIPGVEALNAEIAGLKAEIDTASKEAAVSSETIKTLEAEVSSLTAQVAATETLTKDIAGLREIVEGHVNNMRIALSLSTLDLSASDTTSLLREYKSAAATFEKSLPMGGVVPKPEGAGDTTKLAVSRIDAGAFQALAF